MWAMGAPRAMTASIAVMAVLAGCQALSGLDDYGVTGPSSASASVTGGGGGAQTTGPGCAVAISAGDAHTCAIRNDGTLWCWGEARLLGIGRRESDASPVPAQVTALGMEVDAITCGASHSCALRNDGVLWCWGINDRGQIGNGVASRAIVVEPAPVSALGSGVSRAAVGGGHTCAVANGNLYCWGWNVAGELGIGADDLGGHPVPELVPSIDDAAEPALGEAHSCVRRSGGAVSCWGADGVGQLGQGTAGPLVASPKPVAGLAGVAFELEVGDDHGCARIAGSLRCWGANAYGELGAGFVEPGQIGDVDTFNNDVLDVSLGGAHSCAVLTSNKVYCWGANDRGQLGMEGSELPSEPIQIEALAGQVESLALGGRHSCALTRDAHVLCWGDDAKGQLGAGELLGMTATPVEAALPCP